jgi:polyisoprenoid-binding protein YceI
MRRPVYGTCQSDPEASLHIKCLAGIEKAVSERRDHMRTLAPADAAALLADGTMAGRWVLDPAGSRAEFGVKHFWGAVTVHGWFSQITGEGDVGPDGTVTGHLSIDAASLGTRDKKRDAHLRSADFFDVEHHPHVVVTVTRATPAGPAALACQGSLEAAGHIQPVAFTAHLDDASAEQVLLRAELMVDRTRFAMTWSPLGMTSGIARAIRRRPHMPPTGRSTSGSE